MTSKFDSLLGIHRMAETEPKFEEIAFWLGKTCQEEADKCKDGFNFESWKESRQGRIYIKDKWAVFEFLSDCHSILDHTDWHGKVFSFEVNYLIDIVYDALKGRDDIYNIDKVKKKFPKIETFLRSFGYEPLDKKGWMWSG